MIATVSLRLYEYRCDTSGETTSAPTPRADLFRYLLHYYYNIIVLIITLYLYTYYTYYHNNYYYYYTNHSNNHYINTHNAHTTHAGRLRPPRERGSSIT